MNKSFLALLLLIFTQNIYSIEDCNKYKNKRDEYRIKYRGALKNYNRNLSGGAFYGDPRSAKTFLELLKEEDRKYNRCLAKNAEEKEKQKLLEKAAETTNLTTLAPTISNSVTTSNSQLAKFLFSISKLTLEKANTDD